MFGVDALRERIDLRATDRLGESLVEPYGQPEHGGTLFVDKVAEMPLDLQAKLLRVLEDANRDPIGGTDPVEVDVLIVAATHQSVRRAVEERRFRADLIYRLRCRNPVVPIGCCTDDRFRAGPARIWS